ncbi:hypothetical protein DNU06_15890 [Putridiphycobacter roseus]|uniref:Uncharacterized protein n=1 Tax=Putridiphycobacter roseus TaxID=2219161 RepID=A0A2W1MZ60_9FLAO|nr:hypothetical protein [Putridiphycobacter roseus]PZE15861.1 hypothetical protein DNU06_15890 [Putridiphycobacter roseus]
MKYLFIVFFLISTLDGLSQVNSYSRISNNKLRKYTYELINDSSYLYSDKKLLENQKKHENGEPSPVIAPAFKFGRYEIKNDTVFILSSRKVREKVCSNPFASAIFIIDTIENRWIETQEPSFDWRTDIRKCERNLDIILTDSVKETNKIYYFPYHFNNYMVAPLTINFAIKYFPFLSYLKQTNIDSLMQNSKLECNSMVENECFCTLSLDMERIQNKTMHIELEFNKTKQQLISITGAQKKTKYFFKYHDNGFISNISYYKGKKLVNQYSIIEKI